MTGILLSEPWLFVQCHTSQYQLSLMHLATTCAMHSKTVTHTFVKPLLSASRNFTLQIHVELRRRVSLNCSVISC